MEAACKWLHSDRRFKDWYEKTHARKLWLCGGPAKGKTFLSLYIIKWLESVRKKNPSTTFLSYFFFENGHSSVEDALKALIWMLLEQKNEEKLFDETAEEIARSGTPLRFEDLWCLYSKTLKRLFKGGATHVFCILDGLDECRSPVTSNSQESSLKHLLSKFTSLFQLSGSMRFKLLTASQRTEDIMRELFHSPQLNLEEDKTKGNVDSGIESFVRHRLDELYPPQRRGRKDSTDVDHVKDKILEKAESNFLWVELAVDQLRGQALNKALRILKECHKSLPAAFTKILENISPEQACHVKRILPLVVAAYRPLTFVELGILLGLDAESEVDIAKNAERIVRECCPLLNISPDQAHVHLVHSSVKTFLIQGRMPKDFRNFEINMADVHAQMGQCCFLYAQKHLIYNPRLSTVLGKDEKLFNDRFKEVQEVHLFLDYAARYWVTHCRHGNDASFKFLAERSFNQINPLWHTHWLLTQRHWDFPYADNLAHFAAEIGSTRLMSTELGRWRVGSFFRISHPALAPASNGMTPLHVAARLGHTEVIDCLLKSLGSRVDLEVRGLGMTPLDWAVRNGHYSIARKFLALNPTLVESRGLGMTALNWAGWEGRLDFVKELIVDYGAFVDSRADPEAASMCPEISSYSSTFVWKNPSEVAAAIESCASREARHAIQLREKEMQAARRLGIVVAFGSIAATLGTIAFVSLNAWDIWDIFQLLVENAGWEVVWWVAVVLVFFVVWLVIALVATFGSPLAASMIIVLSISAWAGFFTGWAGMANAALSITGNATNGLAITNMSGTLFFEICIGWIVFTTLIWFDAGLSLWVFLTIFFTSYVWLVCAAILALGVQEIGGQRDDQYCTDGLDLNFKGDCINILWKTFAAICTRMAVYGFAGLVVVNDFFGICDGRSGRIQISMMAMFSSCLISGGTTLIHPVAAALHNMSLFDLCRRAVMLSCLGGTFAWALTEGVSCLRKLKRKKTKLIQQQSGRTTLHLAASSGHIKVVEYLLEHSPRKADINAVDGQKRTALHLAAENNHGDIVKLLQRKHADLGAKDVNGKTAAQLAEDKGFNIIAHALKEVHNELIKEMLV